VTSGTWPDGVGDALDRAVGYLFQSGLAISNLVADARTDATTGAVLRDVSERIDAAVREIRGAAVTRVSDQRARLARSDRADGRVLRRVNIDEVFAYAVGATDFYRATDDELWARDAQGLLVSARSGTPLARREGNLYYDPESGVPLYYEPPLHDPSS